MFTYKKQTDENGEVIACENCGYDAPVSLFYGTLVERGVACDIWLCEVCSTTYLSVALKYPSQCPDVRLYRSIAIIANMILERLPPKPTNGGNNER